MCTAIVLLINTESGNGNGNGTGTRTRLIKIEVVLMVLLTIITCSKNCTLKINLHQYAYSGPFSSKRNGTYVELFHEKV